MFLLVPSNRIVSRVIWDCVNRPRFIIKIQNSPIKVLKHETHCMYTFVINPFVPFVTILYMELWPLYSPGPRRGSQPMLPCVTLCPLITKTVKIPGLNGLSIILYNFFRIVLTPRLNAIAPARNALFREILHANS